MERKAAAKKILKLEHELDSLLSDESKATNNKLSEAGLAGIRELIENAILLDTEVHEHHSNNSKTEATDNIVFNHKMYSLGASENGNIGLYKITIEEYYQSKKEPNNERFHNLKYIEKVAELSADALARLKARSGGSTIDSSTTIYTVSDLFTLVKRFDGEFNPKPSSIVVNKDGSPIPMHHATRAKFTQFDRKKRIGCDTVAQTRSIAAICYQFYNQYTRNLGVCQ